MKKMKIKPLIIQPYHVVLACLVFQESGTRSLWAESPERPNVLLIAFDDLRPELGCYGNNIIKTPNLDKIAGEGLLFTHAYCQQAVCSPSRTSMLTGVRPDTTKVWDLSTHFRKAIPDTVTLPQHFKRHGYFTQSLGKIFHHGLDDKPSWSVPTIYPKAPFGRPPQTTRAGATKAEKRGPATGIVDDGDELTLHDGELTTVAITALEEVASRDEPFFLAVIRRNGAELKMIMLGSSSTAITRRSVLLTHKSGC